MAPLEAAGTGEGVSLSPDQAGRLRKAVDRVADQARRPAAEAELGDHLASIQATGAGLGGVTERARAALDRTEGVQGLSKGRTGRPGLPRDHGAAQVGDARRGAAPGRVPAQPMPIDESRIYPAKS